MTDLWDPFISQVRKMTLIVINFIKAYSESVLEIELLSSNQVLVLFTLLHLFAVLGNRKSLWVFAKVVGVKVGRQYR